MKLSDAFEYFDRRNDGVITFEEVSEMIIKLYIISLILSDDDDDDDDE